MEYKVYFFIIVSFSDCHSNAVFADMRIYKKPCASHSCSNSCPGINCIPPGETVTVGVRCWMIWQKDDDRQYTMATFDIVSISETSHSREFA